MKSYSANRLEYSFQSETQALALFSEMYYPKGWRAFVNGEPVEIIRANYLLRGLVLPAGEGDVVFEFHPKSYFVGNVVSYASSALLLLLSVWVLIVPIFRKPKKEVES
jgi:uncharacterized membrane protein YfhO